MFAMVRATRASGSSRRLCSIAHELAEPLVELRQNEAVEGDAGFQQPEKRGLRHQRNTRFTQGDDVVFACLPLEHRTFPEPGIEGSSREGHGLSGLGQARKLYQTVDHTDPDIGGIPLVTRIPAGLQVAHDDRRARTLQLIGQESVRPFACCQQFIERAHCLQLFDW
jgi:hypothetical protein